MKQEVSNKIFAAVIAKFQAQKLEAEANLVGIVFNSVNVAEHVNLVDEAYEAVKKLAEAEHALATIQRHSIAREEEV